VRIRILKHSTGILAGVSLSQFLPGLVYEVPASLGTFLIGEHAGEEDLTDAIAIPVRSLPPAIVISPPDRTDDRPPRKKKRQ